MTTKPETFSLPLNHKGIFTAAMVAICWLVLCGVGQAQNITLERQVTPVEAETTGLTTDLDSRYSIVATPDKALVLSYIGYETAEVPSCARTSIGITLTY